MLKSEKEAMHVKYEKQIGEIMDSYHREQARVEEVYINKIEYLKEQIVAIKKEWEVKLNFRVAEKKEELESEISRLTVLINLFKDKLARRENENRSLLSEINRLKRKLEVISQQHAKQIKDLEMVHREKEEKWKREHAELLQRYRNLSAEHSECPQTIKKLKELIAELNEENKKLKIEINRLREEIDSLNRTIKDLNL